MYVKGAPEIHNEAEGVEEIIKKKEVYWTWLLKSLCQKDSGFIDKRSAFGHILWIFVNSNCKKKILKSGKNVIVKKEKKNRCIGLLPVQHEIVEDKGKKFTVVCGKTIVTPEF